MYLTRQTKIQLAIVTVVATVGGSTMALNYVELPDLLFGAGHYRVSVELPRAAGLYANGNVTYRGVEVGRVDDVHLNDEGVQAVLSLKSNIPIPADVDAEIHSVSALGEQYVALLPRSANGVRLKDGDVIAENRTSVPPDINSLVDAADRGIEAIPHGDLTTVIDESYTAIAGLGPEISRIVKGSTQLAIDGRNNIEPLTRLIDQSQPVLQSQADTAGAIQTWAAHAATITGQLQTHDSAVASVLEHGGPAADEARQLLERLQPTLPIVLANLVSVGQVAITYQNGIEQLLVLVPHGVSVMQAGEVTRRNNKSPDVGQLIDFQLNLNLPPPCTTGFLPPQQQRTDNFEDSPDRPEGDLYCRIPQDSAFNVRGARNIPCETVPGKRAPTVKMCESDEQYVPLNDGLNWKGDPNATLSGQGIPQLPPGAVPSHPTGTEPPPIAVAQYDPATGTYLGPDGKVYTRSDLAETPSGPPTWQKMLIPPG
ncbi:MAG: phospholipid/cholesterol/gamma-HCH transport system substrate-binding protein [Mycobacterium sp.]|nr:phospholipid/cholesterol/gamma-HCH transport system substrate-binding protein [Mycobacterium sp.]